MENKCPKCSEPLITRTIKKEIGLGSIDYPVAQVCPKCNWNKDLTGAGDLISKPVAAATVSAKKEKEKPPAVTPVPAKAQSKPETQSNINKLITVALALLVLGGLVWAFYPGGPEKAAFSPPNSVSDTPAPVFTGTFVPEATATPTGVKKLVKLDGHRGFIPAVQNIKPGDEVVWDNIEKDRVTLVSKDGLFEAKELDYGKTKTYVFTKPGTYGFYLEKNEKLNGTIMVAS